MFIKKLVVTVALIPQLCLAQPPECPSLETPASYYNRSAKSYLMATDQCQADLFSDFGFELRKKPKSKSYANLVSLQYGTMAYVYYYSDLLKTNYHMSSGSNVYEVMVKALGLKKGRNDTEGFSVSDRDLIREARICCDPETSTLVSCAKISDRDYLPGFVEASGCKTFF